MSHFRDLGLDSKKTPTKKLKPHMASGPENTMVPRAEDMPMDDLSEIDDDEPLVEEEASYNNLRITTVGLLRLLPGWVIAKTKAAFGS